MKYYLYVAIVLVGFLGCSEASTEQESSKEPTEDLYATVMEQGPEQLDTDTLRKKVEALKTDHEKIAFLKKIMTEDQRVRAEESEANQTYGYHSNEHKEKIAQAMIMDAQNLQRVDMFTEVYGPPKYNSVGRMQTDATWLAVHHSSLDVYERYFQILYDAWEQEMLDGTAFAFYLNRWYEKKTGDRHVMEGSYTEEEEVSTLIELLEVEPE